MSLDVRAADRDDLDALWPVVRAAQLFTDPESFASWWEQAPWRVRIGDGGHVVLLGRWREHLPYGSVLGMWCPMALVAPLMRDSLDACRAHGLTRLVGPFVPEEEYEPYREAGFEVQERIVMCRRALSGAATPSEEAVPHDVVVLDASADDEEGILALDAACFDEFWRYDPETFRSIARAGTVARAVRAGRTIGYTLWVRRGTEGTVARLAVDPTVRDRGVGSALLREAVARLAREGARAATLTTQEENEAARRLYLREGFHESPRGLVCIISPPEAGSGAGKE